MIPASLVTLRLGMNSHRVVILLEWFYWNGMATYNLNLSLIFNYNKSNLSFIHIACYKFQRTVM